MSHITKSYKSITEASYQATAQEFAHNVADLAPMHSIDRFVELLPENAKIIDIGCGSGRDAKIFSEMGFEVLGIDYSSKLLEIAKIHAPLASFQLMDIELMKFPAASFDGAWVVCSLSHIPKKLVSQVLQQIYNLLKPGGSFYLAVKKGDTEGLTIDKRYEGNHQKFWSFFEEQEIIGYLENAQFTIMECTLVEKQFSYQTQAAYRIFCHKE